MHTLAVATSKRCEFVDITAGVTRLLPRGIDAGVCIVYCPHTTGALTINENADPSVPRDILRRLEELVPVESGYLHREGNADAHIKSALLGHSVTVIIEKGALALGTWQGIFFCEFDGPRQRQVYVQVIETKRRTEPAR